MLHLQKDTANKIYIQVSDLVIIDNPVYLFRFLNTQTQREYLVELTNEYPDNRRFDLFTLTLPDDLDLDTGLYRYWVYESDTTGRTDYANMRTLAENSAELDRTFTSNTVYEPTDTADKVYKGA